MGKTSGARLFVQWLDSTRVREKVVGEDIDRALSPPYLSLAGRRSRVVRDAIGWLLRWTARAVMVSPALILTRLGPTAVADAGLLGFVGIVVLFFFLVNAYVVAFTVHWHARKWGPSHGLRTPFSDDGDDRFDLFEDRDDRPVVPVRPHGPDIPAQPGQLIRARGKVTRLDVVAHDPAPVVADLWCTEAEPPWRVTTVVDFYLRADDQVPIIVCCSSAPIVVGSPEQGRAAALVDQVHSSAMVHVGSAGLAAGDEAGELLRIVEGDEVEIVGTVDQLVTDVGTFELDGAMRSIVAPGEATSAYRRMPRGPGVVVRSAPGMHVSMRRA